MMDDLISRKALCDYALNQKDKSVTPNDIMRFPSAQPYTEAELQKIQELEQAELQKAYECGRASARQEIIHCRECRYYYFADNRCYGESDDIRWPPDGFCSFAERREDDE